MADRIRKSLKDYKEFHAHVTQDSYVFLNQEAGEYSIGVAIDNMVRELRILRSRAKSQPAPAESYLRM